MAYFETYSSHTKRHMRDVEFTLRSRLHFYYADNDHPSRTDYWRAQQSIWWFDSTGAPLYWIADTSSKGRAELPV